MRVLLTGASSFTGFWFAKTLKAKGATVAAPLRGRASAYEGVRANRVKHVASVAQIVEDVLYFAIEIIFGKRCRYHESEDNARYIGSADCSRSGHIGIDLRPRAMANQVRTFMDCLRLARNAHAPPGVPPARQPQRLGGGIVNVLPVP